MSDPLLRNENDEELMRRTLLKCYGTKPPFAFRTSKEHYRYMAEQIIALREHIRRNPSPAVREG